MPEYKNQHYVSQLILRKFACDAKGKFINIYNRRLLKTLFHKPIKPQAQEDYFYGKDGDFEQFLRFTEDRVGPIIDDITYNVKLPSDGTKSYSFLLHYIMLYLWRTKSSVDRTMEGINKLFTEWTKNDPKFEEFQKNGYKIAHPEPAAYNLATFMDSWVVAADLIPYLVLNYTERQFILSDNPLVTYNPFMQNKDCHWSANSILSNGFTMLFPLTPYHYLLFVDSKFYDVKSTVDNIIPIEDEEDINLINTLQAISADQNLYFSNDDQMEYVTWLSQMGLEQRKDKAITKIISNPDNPKSLMQMSYTIQHEVKNYFSFLRESNFAKDYDVKSKLRHPRNDEIVNWINDMISKL